ncbi:MAG: ADP-ribosylglycohydrolase family protein [Cyclobacteriaceae bacterium]
MIHQKHSSGRRGRAATMKIFSLLVLTGLCSFSNVITPLRHQKEYIILPREVVVDKIRGGLLGQMLGNLNGLPHEMKYIDEPGNVRNYVPSLPDGAWSDDDTDFEWVYVVEMQKSRTPMLSHDQIYQFWKERINKRVWCSNLYARTLMDIGIKPPYTGNGVFNPWANFNISGQFLSETFGLMSPAMPQTAARIGLNYTTVAIDNEPAQSTQLFTAMVSTAFMEKDINKILDAGTKALDQKSILLEIIHDMRSWHRAHPHDWRETRRLLKEKYTREGGNFRDTNGHELNTGSIIAALLYGSGNFSESLKYAFNFGWDADCNAATVGTIVGVIHGYRQMMSHNDPYDPDWKIVDRYRNVTRDNMPMDETITSFADRVIELFEMINLKNGGAELVQNNTVVFKIPVEKPFPVKALVSSNEKNRLLKEELERSFVKDLLSGTRENMARAAYLAVCLDSDAVYAKKYPREWKEACYHLSGYWKVMNNIFSKRHDFVELQKIQKKFTAAGFRSPVSNYSNQELWNDKVLWKAPEEIYTSKK